MTEPFDSRSNPTAPPELTAPLQNSEQVLEVHLPTFEETALLEYGRQLMLKSVERAIEFHKTMLGVSATFGTLVTSLAPLLAWGDRNAKLPTADGWLLIIPPILMILSSAVFAFGYYPRPKEMRINVIEDIRDARDAEILWRKRLAGIGLGLFSIALLLTVIFSLVVRLGVK